MPEELAAEVIAGDPGSPRADAATAAGTDR
jgi:hypothetical protein